MAVKEIVKDIEFLSQKSNKADIKSAETKEVIRDLIDTANANKDRCIGLSAIQIGVPLRVCVVFNGVSFIPFVNPIIVKSFGDKYEAEEGCMSLDGTRKVFRYERIEVIRKTSSGFTKERFRGIMAEILQHEIDHFDGKLI
jgi:peptide deformylase